MELTEKLDRVTKLEKSLREKMTKDWDTYRPAVQRASNLFFDIKCWARQKFASGQVFHWEYDSYKKWRAEKKAEKKKVFETTYRFGVWFMQTSLGADYGEYTCQKCKRTFYHSPCEIYLAKEKLYNCACGYCTNYYAGMNGQNEIYF